MSKIKTLKSAGFSLIEISIATLIASLIATATLNVNSGLKEAEKMLGTHNDLLRIEEAIKDYFSRNYTEGLPDTKTQWPCPAPMNVAEGAAGFGVATICDNPVVPGDGITEVDDGFGNKIRIGAVPIYTLSLPLQYYRDRWHSRILYAVTVSLAKSTTVLADFSASAGKISIIDGNGVEVTDGGSGNDAGWILVSHGMDFKGGYSDQGAVRKACGATTNLDVQNCDYADATFRQARFNKGTVENTFFDDLVLWGMPNSTIPCAP